MTTALILCQTDRAVYVWHGGDCIECYDSTAAALDPDCAPFDALNVWDYGTDRPTIERTPAALAAYIEQHEAEALDD